MDQSGLHIHDELIARCQGGDRDAHYQLYKLYSKAMLNVAYRITRSEPDAEDVLQEAFISAFRNLDKYRGDATFGAWLKRIVVNKAINALNKNKYETIPDDDEQWDVAEEVTAMNTGRILPLSACVTVLRNCPMDTAPCCPCTCWRI